MHLSRLLPHQKGYKCYSPQNRKFYHTMDVTFFENQPYYPKVGIQGEQTYPIEVVESQLLGFELAESVPNTEPTNIAPTQEEITIENAENATEFAQNVEPAEIAPVVETEQENAVEIAPAEARERIASQQNQSPATQGDNWTTYFRKRRKIVESSTDPRQSHESNQTPENEFSQGV
ncbi:uncharacterized protein LOC114915839 [Cajanus cajan]|uniref:uncharacterized protein LOC114915839 n=1 Tax=Cajanus cajan TaxID=3821 RepID=UPI0010FB48B3|nr:uncharacterized protein LOC114915839 [Cajanus cajan]